GLSSQQDFLTRLSSQIKQLQNSPGRLAQTLEQSSREVWTNSFSGVGGNNTKSVSYYIKGPVVGFLLDARIRRATGGSKTLDDLMRLAYERYSGDRGFTAEQFREAAEAVAGVDLKEWFRQAISSTEELDYSEALDWFGLRFAASDGQKQEKTWRLEPRPDATAAQKTHLTAWLDAAGSPTSSIGRKYAEATVHNRMQGLPEVPAPPGRLFAKGRERDWEAAPKFYKKYIDVKGLPVVASADVADEALQRTYYLVTHLLAGRPDILQAMIDNGTRLIVIGKDQV